MEALVQRIEKLEFSSDRFKKKKKYGGKFRPSGPSCSHCTFLNQQLGAKLNTNHSNNNCGKKSVSISLLESINDSPDIDSCSEENEGDITSSKTALTLQLQKYECSSDLMQSSTASAVCSYSSKSVDSSSQTIMACISEYKNLEKDENTNIPPFEPEEITHTGIKDVMVKSETSLAASLARLSTSKYPWKDLQRSCSPRLKCSFNGTSFSALVDSGAEVN